MVYRIGQIAVILYGMLCIVLCLTYQYKRRSIYASVSYTHLDVYKRQVAIEAPSHIGGNPVSPAPKAAGMQFTASVSPKAIADVRPIEVICCASCLEKSVYMPIAIKSRAPNKLAVFCISAANKEDAQQRTKLTRPEIKAIHALILVPISLPWHPYAMPIQRLSRLVASAKMKMETLCTPVSYTHLKSRFCKVRGLLSRKTAFSI